MGNTERKQRKRNKEPFVKEAKTPTPPKTIFSQFVKKVNREDNRTTILNNRKLVASGKKRTQRKVELKASKEKYVLAQKVITEYWENKGYIKTDKGTWEKL